MERLTDEGLEGIDKIVDVELPTREIPKEILKPTKEEKKEEIKKFNENPATKNFGVMAISKKTYYGLWIFAGVILFLFALNIIWSNVLYAGKDMGTNITINNQQETPNIPINVENNNTHNIYINNTIIIPDEFIIKYQNQTNSTWE